MCLIRKDVTFSYTVCTEKNEHLLKWYIIDRMVDLLYAGLKFMLYFKLND